jgi:multicomponent Na+:H+ antiporter subunit F
MTGILIGIAIFIALLISLPLYRVLKGPTVYDRVIGAGLIGTNTIILLAFVGFIYQRLDMFIDLAVVYALLNFVGTIAAAKYLERKRKEQA